MSRVGAPSRRGKHKHGRPIVVHRNYAHLGHEPDEDIMAMCPGCLAEKGLIVSYKDDDLGHIGSWDVNRYPYDPTAKIGDVRYRPGPDWPPSMDEVESFGHRNCTDAVT